MELQEYVIDIPAEFRQGKRPSNKATRNWSSIDNITNWRRARFVDLYEGDCINCGDCTYIVQLSEDKLVFSRINAFKLPPYFAQPVWPLRYWGYTDFRFFEINFSGCSIMRNYGGVFVFQLKTNDTIVLSIDFGPLDMYFLQALISENSEPVTIDIFNENDELLSHFHTLPDTPWGNSMKAIQFPSNVVAVETKIALDILPYSMLAAMGPPTFPNPNTNRLITNAIQYMAAIKEELTPWIHRGPGGVVAEYL